MAGWPLPQDLSLVQTEGLTGPCPWTLPQKPMLSVIPAPSLQNGAVSDRPTMGGTPDLGHSSLGSGTPGTGVGVQGSTFEVPSTEYPTCDQGTRHCLAPHPRALGTRLRREASTEHTDRAFLQAAWPRGRGASGSTLLHPPVPPWGCPSRISSLPAPSPGPYLEDESHRREDSL